MECSYKEGKVSNVNSNKIWLYQSIGYDVTEQGTIRKTDRYKDSRQLHEMKKLQIKQQQLQNEMLLIKITGSDSTSNSAERLKLMKEKLEEVSNHIREVRKDTYISERSNPSPWQNLEDVKN